jgi:predicted transcriptional regulator
MTWATENLHAMRNFEIVPNFPSDRQFRTSVTFCHIHFRTQNKSPSCLQLQLYLLTLAMQAEIQPEQASQITDFTTQSARAEKTDAILPMRQPYMDQIVSGIKDHEFRRYRISHTVKRVWFYVTAPESRISHICEISEAKTREEGDEPLPETGRGNKEFNERHPDWEGSAFAYEVKGVWELRKKLTLKELKGEYGFKAAPRGLVYVTPEMLRDVKLEEQIKIR